MKEQIVTGGYENFAERGAFENIYATYDSEVLSYFLDGCKELIESTSFFMNGTESILDVGTGTGHTALTFAKRFPNCKVVGIDNSQGMLSQAIGKKHNLKNITFQKHNWDNLQTFPGEFDVVANSFGLNFVANLEMFISSLMSKIKTNGILAIVNLADREFPLLSQLFKDLESMSLLRRSPTPVTPINQYFFELLERTGIKPVKKYDKHYTYQLKNPDDWWTIITSTAIKENFFNAHPEEIELFKNKHLKNVQNLIDKGKNNYEVGMTFFIGKKDV